MASGLILVDIQNDYFRGGAMELVAMEQASIEGAHDLVYGGILEQRVLGQHVDGVLVRPAIPHRLGDAFQLFRFHPIDESRDHGAALLAERIPRDTDESHDFLRRPTATAGHHQDRTAEMACELGVELEL